MKRRVSPETFTKSLTSRSRKQRSAEKMTASAKTQSEANIQRSIVHYLRTVLPDCLTFAIPNGSQRTASGRPANAVAGLLPGVPDLCVLLPRGEVVFFEVKALKGRVSDNQLAIHMAMHPLDHRVAVVRSIEEVRLALKAWNIRTKESIGDWESDGNNLD